MNEEIVAEKCCGSVTTETATGKESGRSIGGADDETIKGIVREFYKKAVDERGGCGCGCGDSDYDPEYSLVKDEYKDREGYESDADLGLGCGVPTQYADIVEGDAVLDLGSGAGIDAFIARAQTGESGQVVGVDFTSEMVEKARENARKLGYENVEFIEGDIDDLPVKDESVNVIISNCVLNLVPDKSKAFAEMYRVTSPGGHFCVSDIVILGDIPDRLRESAAAYAGCVSGAIDQEIYLELLREAGFTQVKVVQERPITLPDSVLSEVASQEEIDAYRASGGIASITVTGIRA